MPRLRRPCHLATPRELCGACGSPRQVCHATLDTLSIAHVDCDAFNATVEERDRPDLVDRPVIIDGGSCGVVLACCYVARLYGVPLDYADVQRTGGLRGCGGDPIGHGEISRVGRSVRAEMLRLTPLVEPLSIDEAFLDLGGTKELHGACPSQLCTGPSGRRRARYHRVDRRAKLTASPGFG